MEDELPADPDPGPDPARHFHSEPGPEAGGAGEPDPSAPSDRPAAVEPAPARFPRQWQLPAGVPRALWEYAQTTRIADDYDAYFSHHQLFDFDERTLLAAIEERGGRAGQRVADLGCGTGRALVHLARHGYRGLAVDLSPHMLRIVRRKAREESLPIEVLRANLVELDGVADQALDHACCLFSTLGMIRGRTPRRQALAHVRRILKPDGVFVLHVHNRWFNLYDPGGPWWLVRSFVRSRLEADFEMGDKIFPYRGVNNMFLHVFSRGELTADLRVAGFHRQQWIGLDPRRHRALRWPWLAGRLRANGWIIVCQ